jgi:hypothetical protein
MGLLGRIKPSRKCRRCGLRHRPKAERCPHCADLDEAGLAELKTHIRRQHRANAGLGRLFLYAAGLILAALVVMLAA